MQRRHLLILFSLFALPRAVAAEVNVSGSVFSTVGKAKDIAPLLLYSVALAESAFHKKGGKIVKPWQFALRTSSRAYYGENYEDTVKELHRILKTTSSVVIGLMQINLHWHAHRVSNPEDLLNAKTNVSVAADILKERLIANHGNWPQALAQYHSFDADRGSWYGSFVLSIYQQLLDLVTANSDKYSFLTW